MLIPAASRAIKPSFFPANSTRPKVCRTAHPGPTCSGPARKPLRLSRSQPAPQKLLSTSLTPPAPSPAFPGPGPTAPRRRRARPAPRSEWPRGAERGGPGAPGERAAESATTPDGRAASGERPGRVGGGGAGSGGGRRFARSRGGSAGDPLSARTPGCRRGPRGAARGIPALPRGAAGGPRSGLGSPRPAVSALRGPLRASTSWGVPLRGVPVRASPSPRGGVSGRDEWPAACRAVRNGDVCRRPGRGPHRRMMDAATPPLPPPTDPSCAPRTPPGLRAAAPAVPAAFLYPQLDGIP